MQNTNKILIISSDNVEFKIKENHKLITKGNLVLFDIKYNLPLHSELLYCILEDRYNSDSLKLLNCLNSILQYCNKEIERKIIKKLFKNIKDPICLSFATNLDIDKLLDLFDFIEEYSMELIENTINHYAYNFELNYKQVIPLIIKEENMNPYTPIKYSVFDFSDLAYCVFNFSDLEWLYSSDVKPSIIINDFLKNCELVLLDFERYVKRFHSFNIEIFSLLSPDVFFNEHEIMIYIIDNFSKLDLVPGKNDIFKIILSVCNSPVRLYILSKLTQKIFNEDEEGIISYILFKRWAFDEIIYLINSGLKFKLHDYYMRFLVTRKDSFRCKFNPSHKHHFYKLERNIKNDMVHRTKNKDLCSCIKDLLDKREKLLYIFLSTSTSDIFPSNDYSRREFSIAEYILGDRIFSLEIKKFMIEKELNNKNITYYIGNPPSNFKKEIKDYYEMCCKRNKNYNKKKRCNKKRNSNK